MMFYEPCLPRQFRFYIEALEEEEEMLGNMFVLLLAGFYEMISVLLLKPELILMQKRNSSLDSV